MFTVINGVMYEAYELLNKMSPYLLFGFFFAGVLHTFISTETISRHLGKRDIFSVVKAALLGIPLPLCSCSVIPAAMSLRKEGASKGSVLSFLISTPTTGIDSIFATYSLLGWFFTIYRIIASFVIGAISGIISNFLDKDPGEVKVSVDKCKFCEEEKSHEHGIFRKIKEMFKYAFGILLDDTGPALILGVFIGGAITYFLPSEFIGTYIGSGLKSKLVMMAVGVPMYVCATASIPIAASLMMKGLDPGAAFVFLVAGPATNIVTMAVIGRNMGKRALFVYLFSIMGGSVLLGSLFSKAASYFLEGNVINLMKHQGDMFPAEVSKVLTLVLMVLILFNMIRNRSLFFKKYSKRC